MREVPAFYGQCHLQDGGLDCCKKGGWANHELASQEAAFLHGLPSSVFASRFWAWIPASTFFNDGLWCGNAELTLTLSSHKLFLVIFFFITPIENVNNTHSELLFLSIKTLFLLKKKEFPKTYFRNKTFVCIFLQLYCSCNFNSVPWKFASNIVLPTN